MKKVSRKDMHALAMAMGAIDECSQFRFHGAIIIKKSDWNPLYNDAHSMMVLKWLAYKITVEVRYRISFSRLANNKFTCYPRFKGCHYAVDGDGCTLPEAITRLALKLVKEGRLK